MRYKKYLNSLVISIFAVSAIMFGSFHNDVSAGFWDWFGVGNDSQPAVVSNTKTTYKWVNNGLVSENSGKYTGTCAKKQVTTYTCSSSNVGNKLYDGTNRGASYSDVGHAWPIYEGENTSTATEYTWSGCGLDKRTGGQVNEWECKSSGVTSNSSSSSSSSLNSVPKIISPNGGENWVIGTNQNILFYSAGIGGRKAKILLVDKNDVGANTWSIFNYTIADIILGNEEEGLYSWTWKVGDAKRIDDGAMPVSGSYKIKICIFPDSGSNSSNTVCDNSDALFNMVSGGSSSSLSSSNSSSFKPFVKIISPNGGEVWTRGTTYEIKYQTNVGHSLKIALVKGLYEKKYVMSIGDTASYSDINTYKWSVPYGITLGNDYFIRIGSEIGSVGYEFSDSPFTISSNTSGSSSSTSSGVLAAVTGGADYDSAHATAYLNGTIYNPNKENVFYYFKYGKEKEPSSSAKQTVWATINSGSSANVTALTSSLSSGIKYVYRLYVYSNTTGSTVSGELKSFTTLSSSSSSISSSSSNSSSSSSQGFSLSQLVELLISLGVISPDKADLARTAVKNMGGR